MLTKSLHHFRFFSHSAKPDLKYAETFHAVVRVTSGKNIAAKERRAGRVPSIVFEQEDGQRGGNKRLISAQANQIRKLVNHLFEVHPDFESTDVIEKVRVLPRKVFSLYLLDFVNLN